MDKRTVVAMVRSLKEQMVNLEKMVLMMPDNGGGPVPVYPQGHFDQRVRQPHAYVENRFGQPVEKHQQHDPRYMSDQDEAAVEKLIEAKRQEAQAMSEEAMPNFQQMQAEAMAQAETMNVGLQSGSGLADSINQLKQQ